MSDDSVGWRVVALLQVANFLKISVARTARAQRGRGIISETSTTSGLPFVRLSRGARRRHKSAALANNDSRSRSSVFQPKQCFKLDKSGDAHAAAKPSELQSCSRATRRSSFLKWPRAAVAYADVTGSESFEPRHCVQWRSLHLSCFVSCVCHICFRRV